MQISLFIKSILKKLFPLPGLDYDESLPWTHITIHHSWKPEDTEANDWKGITRYWTSWRYKGRIITPEKAKELKAAGKKVDFPYLGNPYHMGLEKERMWYKYRVGRPLSRIGAHCPAVNRKAIGVCIIGNYNKKSPSWLRYYLTAQLCIQLMKQYKIKIENIEGHRKYSEKTCPGSKFDLDLLKKFIKEEIDSERQS